MNWQWWKEETYKELNKAQERESGDLDWGVVVEMLALDGFER